MPWPALELLGPLRTAILQNSDIIPNLGEWTGDPSVHTRRPVPDDADYPMIVVGPMITRGGDTDGVNDHRPVAVVDITTYGKQPAHYRIVDTVAELLFSMFHRSRDITVSNYSVTTILASGPYPAPSDDEDEVARRVTLSISLRATPS